MKLVGVQIGSCTPIKIGDREVMSGIFKTPVASPVEVKKLGLSGDEQADPSVHGRLSKAVYAYPSEHYGYWNQQARENDMQVPLQHGQLGENLTLSGLLESNAYVGDELHFGHCVLRITQPRQPCFKFNAVMHDKNAAKKMASTGFSGFYLSVVETGFIQAGETFNLVEGDRSTSISELFKVSVFKTRND